MKLRKWLDQLLIYSASVENVKCFHQTIKNLCRRPSVMVFTMTPRRYVEILMHLATPPSAYTTHATISNISIPSSARVWCRAYRSLGHGRQRLTRMHSFAAAKQPNSALSCFCHSLVALSRVSQFEISIGIATPFHYCGISSLE